MTTREMLAALREKALNGEISNPNEIYELYTLANKNRARRIKTQINIGDAVTFTNRGHSYEGKITKINRKTANIKVTHMDSQLMNWPATWKCSIGSLSFKQNVIQKIKEKLS